MKTYQMSSYLLVTLVLVALGQDLGLDVVAESTLDTLGALDIQTHIQVCLIGVGFVAAFHALDLTLKVSSKDLVNKRCFLDAVVHFAVRTSR